MAVGWIIFCAVRRAGVSNNDNNHERLWLSSEAVYVGKNRLRISRNFSRKRNYKPEIFKFEKICRKLRNKVFILRNIFEKYFWKIRGGLLDTANISTFPHKQPQTFSPDSIETHLRDIFLCKLFPFCEEALDEEYFKRFCGWSEWKAPANGDEAIWLIKNVNKAMGKVFLLFFLLSELQ